MNLSGMTRLQLVLAQTVDLGIRPEYVEIKEPLQALQDAQRRGPLRLGVSVIEPLGRETLVRGCLPESDVLLDVPVSSEWRGRPRDRISIQFDLDQLFVFDPTTGDVLYPEHASGLF